MAADHVEHIIEQWRRERPDLDVSPMAVIARISRLCRILERRIEQVYAEHGLNQSQVAVLAALRRAGDPYCLSPTALYSSLLISSGAVTNRLERLTAMGLVRRVPDPRDGRSLLVALTPKGKRLIDKVLSAHFDNERRLLTALEPWERDALASFLKKLLLEFEDDAPPHSSTDVAALLATARSSRRRDGGSARSRTRQPATPGR
jgi:DNA-binding MarR family transcriptional regulator